MVFDASIIAAMTDPKFNPPAIVEQLQIAPRVVLVELLVADIEREFESEREVRRRSLESLWELLVKTTAAQNWKQDDQDGFLTIIQSFESNAVEISKKVARLEKDLRKAQKMDPHRDKSLDARILAIARLDLEDRIDVSLFWRAQQAVAWPSPTSQEMTTGDEVLAYLNAVA